MPTPLNGKTALVTGGTQNIGRGIALRLAEDGARVVVGYHANEAAAQSTLQALRDAGADARAIQADVSTAQGVRSLFIQAEEAFGSVDILVANAGLTPTPSPIAETSDEEVDRMLALNVRGAFYQLREGARRVAEGGRIIAVGSGVARANPPGLGLYAATKAAVTSLVETLAKEVGERGITVNAVLPGPTTDDPPENETQTDEAQLSVFDRMGRPNDIASVVAFLARDDAGWVTGSRILASGGAFL